MAITTVDQVAAQLADELGAAAHRLAVIAGPEAVGSWDRWLARRAPGLAHILCHGDDNEAAQAVIDVMVALWPHGGPEDHDPDWWRTPLGRACARSLGTADGGWEPDSITQSVAAAMLGVTRGTIAQLVARGTLDRHPDGGVLRASVLQRIGRT